MSDSLSSPVIALDYDGTVTLNVEAWLTCIGAWKAANFKVYIVTMRDPSERDHPMGSHGPMDPRVVAAVDEVIFTSREPKKQFMMFLGIPVSVWIDNTPEALFLSADEVWGHSTPINQDRALSATPPDTSYIVDITRGMRHYRRLCLKFQEIQARREGSTVSVAGVVDANPA